MRPAEFKWGPLSRRQKKVLTWWTDSSKYKDHNGIIADGAIRSGKTVSMGFSFCLWAMQRFDRQNFALCGKTIGSLRRNVIVTLKRQLRAERYAVQDRRNPDRLVISNGSKANTFYLFGGKDESSQDLIQGVTLAGAFFDEVALMPESFVNQATARCSVTGSKFWFNCNPAGPQHWFYRNWILKCRKRKLVYLHFTMKDNLTLSREIVKRYLSQYVGVFFDRYIRGLWVAAEGLVYDMFDRNRHVTDDPPETEGDWFVSSDFGIQNATTFLLWRRIKGTNRWLCAKSYFYSGRDRKKQKTVAQLADDLDCMLDGIKPKTVILDPSAAPLKVELRLRGYRTKNADNDVLTGIVNVSTLLQQDRLLFDSRCKELLDEFGIYCWDVKAAQHGEDRPLKENDHAMDAVRYFVQTMHLAQKNTAPQTDLLFL